MKLGIQLYTVRDFLAKDMEGTIKSLAEMGYETAEHFGGFSCDADRLAETLEANGMTCVSWHAPLHYLENDLFYGTMAYFKRVGLKYCVFTVGPDILHDNQKRADLISRMKNVQASLAPYGIKTGYHNHWWEFALEALPFKEIFGQTNLLMEFDTGNALKENKWTLDMAAGLFPGRQEILHIKPYSFEKEFACDIGRDSVDWESVKRICREQNTQYLIFEHEDASNAMERAEKNIENMKKLLL